MASRRGIRETVRLLLLQVLVLIAFVAFRLERPVAAAAPLYQALACGAVACVALLVWMSLRTRLVLVAWASVLVVFVGWMLLRGLLDVAATAVAATALGLLLRRVLPPPALTGGAPPADGTSEAPHGRSGAEGSRGDRPVG